MANAALKRVVEQVLDALPETATLQDLLLALQHRADVEDGLELDEGGSAAGHASTEIGLPATCGTRKRRAAGA
ncbi:MAG TPA: hypothetical protein VND91_05275 [Candidatus Saccharimonadia bacterium]|nr:hypothetical protein [Candidatus Saccharimonadia bacterium]